MGGPKTTTTQNSTTSNAYGWQVPPDTADIAAQRGFKFQSDPRIPYTFSRAYQRAKDTYDNPTGGASTPQMRDATLRATAEDLGQEESQAYREENYGRQALEYGKLADVAQMTAPRLTQTSGTTSGTGTQQTNPGLLNTVMQGASLGLMAF